MDGWTGNEIYNLSEDVSRSDKSRYIIESARSRRLSGDREVETAAHTEEDMTASLKPRSFKMKKKAAIPPNRTREGERRSAGVCRGDFFFTVAICVSMSVRARTAVQVQLTDGD